MKYIVKITKRTFLLVLIALLIIPHGQARADTLSNFVKIRSYENNFSDVKQNSWYYSSVAFGYESGLWNGRTSSSFVPDGTVTVAETLKLAAVIHSMYTGDGYKFSEQTVWYFEYINYCQEVGIIQEGAFKAYTGAITRADFAVVLHAALPEEAYAPINDITPGDFPDVLPAYSYSTAVYSLASAGVITGNGGRFYPNKSISRAEASAVTSRITNPSERILFSMQQGLPLTASEVYKKCSPAVFKIEVYNSKDELVHSGSGFFISSDGLAVTNCHVASNAHHAKAVLYDSSSVDIIGYYSRDLHTDAALIKVAGSSYSFLETRDPKTLVPGEPAYAIGSPLGYINVITAGIISAPLIKIDESEYIMTDAAAAIGNSGGALIDSSGKVVGIVTASFIYGQTHNLAKPISVIDSLPHTEYKSPADFEAPLPYYPRFFPAYDFGALTGEAVQIYEGYPDISLADMYYYRSIPYAELEPILEQYAKLLTENLFVEVKYTDDTLRSFICYDYKITLNIEKTIYQGKNYLLITLLSN